MAVAEIEARERETHGEIESLFEREHDIQIELGRALVDENDDGARRLRNERAEVREKIEDCFLVLPYLKAQIRAARKSREPWKDVDNADF